MLRLRQWSTRFLPHYHKQCGREECYVELEAPVATLVDSFENVKA